MYAFLAHNDHTKTVWSDNCVDVQVNIWKWIYQSIQFIVIIS